MQDTDLIYTDIDRYLAEHERKDILRFLTCGSVDDGKSTLIGRLLHDVHAVHEDTLAATTRDSKSFGTQSGELDLALLVDGLKAEREQGITIDVAYRSFTTARRKFIIADTPGHEQFTRNMVTGASTSDLAVILIDARSGVVSQTRRHTVITSLLGIQHLIIAVNKMDLVGYSEARFDEIRGQYEAFARQLPSCQMEFVPVVATTGAFVVERSPTMPWYSGATLLELLEHAPVRNATDDGPFRFGVQWVNRPNLDFRGYAGSLASGSVRVGDTVVALPSHKASRVARIVTFDGDLDVAYPPLAITLTLEDEIDLSRGDMLVSKQTLPIVTKEFDATCVWMDDASPLVVGKEYLLKHGVHTTPVTLACVVSRLDIETLAHAAATTLHFNEIGEVSLLAAQPIAFDPYSVIRTTGAAILIDRWTNQTAGALMLRGATPPNARWTAKPRSGAMNVNPSVVTSEERRTRFGTLPRTLLFYGPHGGGKSRLARAVERALFDLGQIAVVLDAHAMRQGLSRDLGFSREDRSENLRRSMEVAKTLNDAGILVLAACSAPDAAVRDAARVLIGEAQFIGVHVDAPHSDDARACDAPQARDLKIGVLDLADEAALGRAVQAVLTTLAPRALQ